MTLKNAALMALVGTVLLTILLVAGLIISMTGLLRGVVPPIQTLSALIRAFAAVTLAVFFYVFHKAQ
jgi:hypothetical protein